MRIEHIGIAVSDIDTAIETFSTLLGTGVYKSETVRAEGVRTHFLWADGVKIELLESIDESSAVARFLQTRGEGFHHIAFAVNDLGATSEALERSGFRVVGSATRKGADDRRVFFIHPGSAHGVLVECCTDRRAPGAGSDVNIEEEWRESDFVKHMPRLWIVCDGTAETGSRGRRAASLADELSERLEPIARIFRATTPPKLNGGQPTDRVLVISGSISVTDAHSPEQTVVLELDTEGTDTESAIDYSWIVRSGGYSVRLPISAVSPLDPVNDALTPLLMSQWNT